MNTFEKFRSEKSTAIQMARYYSDSQELTIVFSNANSYKYEEVPYHVWRGLMDAESKGRFINRYITAFYRFKKLQSMTEKDITKIAELTAKIIIDHLESKQDEWNQDFQVSMDNIKQDGFGNMRMMSEQEIIHMQIDELQQELDKAVEDENFTLASKINSKIINLKAKL